MGQFFSREKDNQHGYLDEGKKKEPKSIDTMFNKDSIIKQIKKMNKNPKPVKRVTEAELGIKHSVRISYDDPSGKGRGTHHIQITAPDKARARSYAEKDLATRPVFKQKFKNPKIHAVSIMKEDVMDTTVIKQKLKAALLDDLREMVAVHEGRMAEISDAIDRHVAPHIAKFKAGKMDAETLGNKILIAHKRIQDETGHPMSAIKSLVNQHVDNEIG